MLKVGVHSDLHTEFSACTITNLAQLDVLVLAGDIGDLFSVKCFLEAIRNEAPDLPVLYVLGNHEYYGMEFEQAKQQYRQVCDRYQVTLLDNEALQIEDVLFVGSTLWTDFSLAGQADISMLWARSRIPDFLKIRRYSADGSLVAMQPADTVHEYKKACEFIHESLAAPTDNIRKKVVVTHFLPSIELLAPAYCQTPDALIRSAYWASDIPRLYRLADDWLYGHSHDCIETRVGTTRFLSNQRGYSKVMNQAQCAAYQRDYCVEI
ncbi:MAG: serine/threonine protein phosphatase [Alcaligenaceae bacterium]|nr:serine/threonine protein phosphatase [Alcaligenaceae bacterium]